MAAGGAGKECSAIRAMYDDYDWATWHDRLVSLFSVDAAYVIFW